MEQKYLTAEPVSASAPPACFRLCGVLWEEGIRECVGSLHSIWK